VAGLRGGPGAKARGPARTGPSRSLPAATVSPDVHTKADGKQRPLAIAALEDKIVQGATVLVLNAIYEGDFCGFSYGFRPGRGPHDALDALTVAIDRRKVNWILDATSKTSWGGQPSLADSLPGTQDRRQAHHPPDPEMVEGGILEDGGRDG